VSHSVAMSADFKIENFCLQLCVRAASTKEAHLLSRQILNEWPTEIGSLGQGGSGAAGHIPSGKVFKFSLRLDHSSKKIL
ncbi:MAG TPA: hypothetical protein VFM05_10335, partial [Candidatus Saccharimonadales bacterium]|nr:hypothetical protein [Candidatus Saccharimonadales bacterium]